MQWLDLKSLKDSISSASQLAREFQEREEMLRNAKLTNPIIQELKDLQQKLENENLNSRQLLEIKNKELEQLEFQNKELKEENKRTKRNFWITFAVSTLISVIALIVSILK